VAHAQRPGFLRKGTLFVAVGQQRCGAAARALPEPGNPGRCSHRSGRFRDANSFRLDDARLAGRRGALCTRSSLKLFLAPLAEVGYLQLIAKSVLSRSWETACWFQTPASPRHRCAPKQRRGGLHNLAPPPEQGKARGVQARRSHNTCAQAFPSPGRRLAAPTTLSRESVRNGCFPEIGCFGLNCCSMTPVGP